MTQVTAVRDCLARRLPSAAMILGRSLREVRSIIRLNNGDGFTFEDATNRIRVKDQYELRRLLADMVTDNWIANDAPDHWSLTDKARELQTTSRAKLTRERADVLLTEMMDRVTALNTTNPELAPYNKVKLEHEYAFNVDKVVVFGSYLTAKPKIGDIDIAIVLKRRKQANAEQEILEKQSGERAPRGLNMVEDLHWPQTEVRRVVQGGSSFIDLRDLSDLEALFRSGATPKYEVLVGYWHPPTVTAKDAPQTVTSPTIN